MFKFLLNLCIFKSRPLHLKKTNIMNRIIFSTLILSLLIFSCKKENANENDVNKETKTVEDTAVESKISLSKLEGSPKFEDAAIALSDVSVGNVENDTAMVDFNFKVDNYNLGEQTPTAGENGLANSGGGQHIHFILNNQPYHAYYEPTVSKDIPVGNHVLLSFLSRSYHESVKNAFLVTPLKVGEPEGEAPDLSAPHMFYSRPKGTYSGKDTENLLLDFFLVNTEISETGNKVLATIEGEEFEITEWAPYVIKGLGKGEITIRLQLVDQNGELIPGPFNDVTRKVMLE